MLGISETIADEHDTRVDEETDEDAGSDDLSIWILVLVQIPSSAYT